METTFMYKKHIKFSNNLYIIGFGAICRGILPLIFRHIEIYPEQITIITKHAVDETVANNFSIKTIYQTLDKNNYEHILNKHLNKGDFLLNLSVEVSSKALIEYCQQNNVLYLDTSIEMWAGEFVDNTRSPSQRSNYGLREEVLALKSKSTYPTTALVTHGANPGLVSHFVKQALLNISDSLNLSITIPTTREQWARLSQKLSIKVIHIAERDSQIMHQRKRPNEFINTWSIDAFISEGSQPAEIGWGSHERHWPHDAYHHDFGSRCAIYLNRPGAATRVRTWTPHAGAFHAYMITHTENISLADYLTIKNNETVEYRPTVHYAYHPCDDAVLSLQEYAGKEWQAQDQQKIIFDEIIHGMDELGVLLMGHPKGAYWFGSQLSIQQTRELIPYNNATSLQVAVGALSGMIWVMKHPHRGILEPDEVDHAFILEIATPYLGKIVGEFTQWTPLVNREKLFVEKLDKEDPWQFVNMRIN